MEEKYFKGLDSKRDEMVERVIHWSNINSGSLNVPGLERMAAVLTQAFSTLGGEGNVLSLPPINQIDVSGETIRVDLGPILRFSMRPKAPIQVLLVGHMDTVYGLDHPFQQAKRVSDRVVGPGVTDMKGGLCVMLESLRFFEESIVEKQLGWEVVINPDEEVSSLGSAPFLETRAQWHQVGLLFEPALDEKGTLVGERKGNGKFTFIVHGRASHAGRDLNLGRNAIVMLARLISEVEALNGKREGVTFNVGLTQGGGAVNVVPAFAMCRIDVRILKSEDEKWVREALEKLANTMSQQEGFKVTVTGKFNRVPKLFDPKMKALYQLVVEVGKNLGESITWESSGGGSDGNNLAHVGLPNVDSLGVCGGNIHSEEEYLLVDSLISRTKLTAGLLFKLNEGAFKALT